MAAQRDFGFFDKKPCDGYLVPMRFKTFLTLHTAILSAAYAWAQSPTSDVVGQSTYTLPAGNSVWVPPFVAEDSFSGRVDEMIYNAGADETFISLNTDSLPASDQHYLELGEGAEAGLALDIISSSGNGVTVKGDVQALGLLPNHRIVIREHLTLGALLPEGADFAPFQDTVSLFQADGSRLDVFWNPFSASWTDSFNVSWDEQKILPGQGLLVFLNESLSIPLGANGEFNHVKTTPTRFLATANAINLVGPINPFPGSYSLSEVGYLADLSPLRDSVNFFTTDGMFLPDSTYLSDGGLISGDGAVFLNGSGEDSSNVQLAFRQAGVVDVMSDKTIGLAPAQVSMGAGLNN